MISLKQIVVATDLSSHSLAAVRCGCELADEFGAAVHLLYVVSHPFAEYAEQSLENLDKSFGDYEEEHQRAAEEELTRVSTDPLSDPERVVRVTRTGVPAVEIPRYAEQSGADLLVLATHGHSGLSHVLMGSVCEAVVRQARCPVMTIRND